MTGRRNEEFDYLCQKSIVISLFHCLSWKIVLTMHVTRFEFHNQLIAMLISIHMLYNIHTTLYFLIDLFAFNFSFLDLVNSS